MQKCRSSLCILIRTCILRNKLQTSFLGEFIYSYRTMVHTNIKMPMFFTYIYGLWLLKFNIFRWHSLQGMLMTYIMFVCTMVLYEYMNSPRNDVCNFIVNTHVRIKIYREFYHCIIYIANEGRHVRIVFFRDAYKHNNACIVFSYIYISGKMLTLSTIYRLWPL
jgi:hypothetical protein